MVDAVSTALEIRRGSLRLADVPIAERPVVSRVLQSMTDAQCGTILWRREKAPKQFGRSAVHSRSAHS